MKPSKFLACVAVGFLLSACSADDPEINPGNTDATFEGDGYLAISINLPTLKGTRALNDVFDDGSDNEYYVKDGVLVLFKGTDEGSAVCQAAYDLSDIKNEMSDPADDNITSNFKQAIKVENVSLGANEHLYGFVMLNYTDIASVFDNNLMLKGGAHSGAIFKGTFNEFRGLTSSLPFYQTDGEGNATYFLMSNSPVAKSMGGLNLSAAPGKDVETLVELKGALQPTKEEALKDENISGDIYVERAVAKATLKVTAKTAKVTGKTLEVDNIKWVIANDEADSYLVRNLTDSIRIPAGGIVGGHDLTYVTWSSGKLAKPNYRFLGSNAINTGLYRHYWCIDPRYNMDKTYRDVTGDEVNNAVEKVLYCHENTFDVAHQNYMNTTRAVLKVTYKGGDFYTLNGDLKKAYSKEDAETYALNYIVKDATLQKAVDNALKEDVKSYDIVKSGCVKIEWEEGEECIHKIKNITLEDNTNFATTPEFNPKSLIERTNELYTIVKYAGGVSYYDFRFMHFGSTEAGEDLAPWTAPVNAATPDVVASYGYGSNPKALTDQSEIDYLGRWGMVRNNWYDVTITAFNTVGSPVVPDANIEKPDDNVDTEQWLSFRINVLSWARRTQSMTL